MPFSQIGNNPKSRKSVPAPGGFLFSPLYPPGVFITMSQLIDIARVSADNAKRIAGGILCSGMGNTQTELLAQAVADLANAVEAMAEQCEPRAPVNQLGQVMPKMVDTIEHAACMEGCAGSAGKPRKEFIGPATCEDVLGFRLDSRPCLGCGSIGCTCYN